MYCIVPVAPVDPTGPMRPVSPMVPAGPGGPDSPVGPLDPVAPGKHNISAFARYLRLSSQQIRLQQVLHCSQTVRLKTTGRLGK